MSGVGSSPFNKLQLDVRITAGMLRKEYFTVDKTLSVFFKIAAGAVYKFIDALDMPMFYDVT